MVRCEGLECHDPASASLPTFLDILVKADADNAKAVFAVLAQFGPPLEGLTAADLATKVLREGRVILQTLTRCGRRKKANGSNPQEKPPEPMPGNGPSWQSDAPLRRRSTDSNLFNIGPLRTVRFDVF